MARALHFPIWRIGALAAGLILSTGGGMAAHAHPKLERADPPMGAIVAAAPAEVRLRFSEPLEPAFSRVEVVDAAGKRVDSGDGRVDPADRRQMRASLPRLAPGAYRVIWRVLSVDTHRMKGDFTFTIRP